jgi:hypothetical protein
MVLLRGIGPPTPSLPMTCSTTELQQHTEKGRRKMPQDIRKRKQMFRVFPKAALRLGYPRLAAAELAHNAGHRRVEPSSSHLAAYCPYLPRHQGLQHPQCRLHLQHHAHPILFLARPSRRRHRQYLRRVAIPLDPDHQRLMGADFLVSVQRPFLLAQL